jgi:hypothetical protein
MNEKGYSYERVSRESEEFNQSKEEYDQFTEKETIVFGESLAKIIKAESSASIPEKVKERLREEKQRRAEKVKKDLYGLLKGRRKSAVYSMCVQLSTRPEIQSLVLDDPEISKFINPSENTGLRQTFAVIRKLIEEESLPDNLLCLMVELHSKEFSKKQEIFEVTLRKELEKLKSRFSKLFKLKRFPLTEDWYDKRIKEITFSLADPVSVEMENLAGAYDADQDQVFISADLTKEKRPNTLTHETMHALSGMTVLLQKEVLSEEDAELGITEGVTIMEYQRVGTRFQSPDTERFRWLNEAITESLTLKAHGQKEGSIYKSEREVLELILKGGTKKVKDEMIYRAYFENFDPNREQHIPAWKTFYREVNESFEPGFLLSLDKAIEKHGLVKTLEVFRANWKKIKEL